jgi:hypothetical protein
MPAMMLLLLNLVALVIALPPNTTSPYPTPRLSTPDKTNDDYTIFLVYLILGAALAFLYPIFVALPATVPSLRRKFFRPNPGGPGPLEYSYDRWREIYGKRLDPGEPVVAVLPRGREG